MTQTPKNADARRIELTTSMQYIRGIGPKRAVLFSRLGIGNVAQLIKHLPHRWDRHAGNLSIGELSVGALATVVGEVTTCRFVDGKGHWKFGSIGNKGRFQMTLEDATHRLDVVWFNAGHMKNTIHPGMTLELTGKVTTFNDYRQMVNPKWKIIEPDAISSEQDEHLRPIYPATEDLGSDQIAKVIQTVLPDVLPQIDDHFDEAYRTNRSLPLLRDAYRMIHAPKHEDEVKIARRRLAYDELLLLQLGLMIRRHHATQVLQAPALRHSEAIAQHILARFPFELTPAQKTVVQQIAADLSNTQPANRLIQGDVGSGKTVVALYALLMAAASNKQGALMAPTELLAEQHYLSISNMLAGSTVRLGLMTGSQTRAQRQALLEQIEAGKIDIVIGTQALLTGDVQFNDLAVVIVDEQHRFGVLQRSIIRSKAANPNSTPHYLVMTATPIPRTLGLTVFGDLDISTIDSLPPGRQPIVTRVVPPEKSDEVYRYVAERIAEGEQAYVVVPAIDESPLDLKHVTGHAQLLQEKYFANHTIATMHGRLTRPEREQIMQQFRKGEIDVLVATTVIEVGVDVPNASVMVIEHAERFGLAQLHQLRGRVGRGTQQSLCVFIGHATTDEGAARLVAIGKTTDGFAIAEADLQIRGIGEMIGTKQSGLPPLRVAQIPKDMELLQLARRDAKIMIHDDPALSQEKHHLLRARLVKQYGSMMIGISDVA